MTAFEDDVAVEDARVRALHDLEILHTPPEREFDELVHLASEICGVPIAALSLIDERTQWLKSKVGLDGDGCAREDSFCTHTVRGGEPFTVPDAQADARFAINPFVTGEPHLRFYSGRPIRTKSGMSVGALCVADRVPRQLTPAQARALDILGRQIEANLELRAQRLRANSERDRAIVAGERFFELSVDPMCIASMTGYFLRVNTAFERVLGYSGQEMLARPHLDLVHPDDVEVTRAEAARLAEHGSSTARFENRCRAKDDSYRWIAWTTVADLSEGLIYAIARDVTDQRKLEAQVVHAQKMDAVGRLAGGIAHDFNNLLSAILGFGHLVDEQLTDGPIRDDLQEVLRAGELAANLTRQLLLFSNRATVEPARRIDINARVRDIDRILHRLIGAEIELVAKCASNLWHTCIDAGHFEQIVMNLAINARDAINGRGKVMIETANVLVDAEYARTQHDVACGEYVMLAVTDDGCGMDKELQARIFEPFFTTKPIGKGTGLGLATVFGIVKQAAGHVAVYSEPGHGTTFKVYLPRNEAGRGTSDSSQVRLPPDRGTETILLVEDDQAVREFARRALTSLGYTVISVGDGRQAIEAVAPGGGTIDLVLTDVIMPGMRGDELVAKLRNNAPGVKFLFMSGHTESALDQRQIFDGSTRFIEKPFSAQRLSSAVRSILDEQVIV